MVVSRYPAASYPARRSALHYAKNSGNFGRKSNGKVRFGSVQLEFSGPPLEVVHFDRSDRNLPFYFDKPVHCPVSLQKISRDSGKEFKKWEECFLAVGSVRIEKCRSIFLG